MDRIYFATDDTIVDGKKIKAGEMVLVYDPEDRTRRKMRIPLQKIAKWGGAVLGVVGCYVLAFNIPQSKYAYVAYLSSSVLMAAVAVRERDWPYVVLNTAFVSGNLIGVYRWLLA